MPQRDPSTRAYDRSKSLRSSSAGRVVVSGAKQSKRLRADDGIRKRGSRKDNPKQRQEQGQRRGRLVLMRDVQNDDEIDDNETNDVEDVDENEEESEQESVMKVNRMINDSDDEEREDDVSDVEEGVRDGGADGEDTSDDEDALPEMSATAGRGNNREGTLSLMCFGLQLVTCI